jgi:cytochrome c
MNQRTRLPTTAMRRLMTARQRAVRCPPLLRQQYADLRGKVIRIRIKEDGTYEIPKGNLFEDGKQGRPEIYTMGHRNPYRLTVDKKTNFVYWGEVGPDANNDSMDTRGPRGYDEVNQARRPGFYGWPLIIGNNYPYHEHNYATGENGPAIDPMKPVNASRNNTGLQNLPPAIPAFIWYPYAVSRDFPQWAPAGATPWPARCIM